MGVVYEAIEEPLQRRVALKVLHPEVARRPEIAARFIEEARSIARLSHPGIVRIHRFGRADSGSYLALELIEGATLDAILERQSLPLGRTLEVLRGIADALSCAHDAGIVHRDLKPGNIFLRPDGAVVLGDFGLAKDLRDGHPPLTRQGDILGTPAYMSPEQAQGYAITPAADVYALGVIAFELVTGRVPFSADTAIRLLLAHVQTPAPDVLDLAPHAPPPLAAFIGRMLQKYPASRPRDGRAVVEALDEIRRTLETGKTAVIGESPGPAPPPRGSILEELEVTLVCVELAGFARGTCEALLPARVAFLLESWYRLVRRCMHEQGGTVDRFIADRVSVIFGFPERHPDHTLRAVVAASRLQDALLEFSAAHGLHLRLRAAVACGSVLAGTIAGDISGTSLQGGLLGDAAALAKTRLTDAPLRLNRAAYRRASALAAFERFEEPRVGEAWAAHAARLPP
jgi:class 3 adenylate cyclase